MHKLICLAVAACMFNAGDRAETFETNAEQARRLRERLLTIENHDLKVHVHVRSGRIQVSGVIQNAEDARRVLDAILEEKGVKTIQLTLGVGREPDLPAVLKIDAYPGNWMDQFDRPSFDPDRLPSP
jgi:hypothetical protein